MKKVIIRSAIALGIFAPGFAFAASNDNEATVYQSYYSNSNLAEIWQTDVSNRNVATIEQTGDVNDAYITQAFVHDSSGGIMQNEAFNYAEIQQLDGSHYAVAVIEQNLENNYAFVMQTNSRNSYAEVFQNGFDNSAEIYQGSANGGGAGNNYAYAEMVGDGDSVVIDQGASTNGWAEAYTEGGGWNQILITQTGNGNTALGNVLNSGSTENIVDIQQNGRLNDATAEVGLYGISTDSIVTIMQEGNLNIAYASADSGTGNDIYVEQIGNANDAFAVADGNSNYVYISQFDNRNVATSESYGDFNVVNISQGGL